MYYSLAVGAMLGMSAGFSPGPLLTLVVAETLSHGTRAGIKVAAAPLITDLPIILLTLLVLAKLSGFHGVLGGISLAGGVLVLAMGWESLRRRPDLEAPQMSAPRSLAKGVLTNALSPHPYLFWLSVGAPEMTRALALHPAALPAFLIGFYSCLIGSKVLLAILTGRSRDFLRGRVYIVVMRLLGLLLLAYALLLFNDGMKLLASAPNPEEPAHESRQPSRLPLD